MLGKWKKNLKQFSKAVDLKSDIYIFMRNNRLLPFVEVGNEEVGTWRSHVS